MKKSSYFILIMLFGVCIALGVLIGNYFDSADEDSQNKNMNQADWLVHTNEYYHYSIHYPASWYFREDSLLANQDPVSSDALFAHWKDSFYSGHPEDYSKATALNDHNVVVTIATYSIEKNIELENVWSEIGAKRYNIQPTSMSIKIGHSDALEYFVDDTQVLPESARMFSKIIYTMADKYLYEIKISASNQDSLDKNKTVLDQMLSTFQYK